LIMSKTTLRATALTTALVVGALLLVGSLIGAIPVIAGILGDVWNGRADLLPGRSPQIPIDGSSAPVDSDGVAYNGVTISSDASLALPRALQAIAATLNVMAIAGGSLLVVLLALRMLRSRPFARLLSWGLGIVGLIAIAAAAIAPQLEVAAVDVAVRELGYAVAAEGHDGTFTADGPDAIALPLWDPLWMLDRVDITLLLIGIMLAVVALLVAEGTRMQKDTEGLV
ncbi:MAG TPA: hypothetical protein VLZ82_03935, partial [Microbacterium sp.]|nr:hypothetical protein [Microbacterium sp.]